MFNLLLKRLSYTLKSTQGELFLNDEYFSYTLEDTSRGENIKIFGETCIPTGKYKVKLSMSSRFKREMPMIFTEDNGYELKNKGISFKGIRIHGGNDSADSHGCVLVAKNLLNPDLIQGSMEKELTDKLRELGGEGTLTVVNIPNT